MVKGTQDASADVGVCERRGQKKTESTCAAYDREQAVLERLHLGVQRGHGHLADDAVGLCLVSIINDVAFPFVGQNGGGSLRAINPILNNGRTIQQVQRSLDLADVLTYRA
jgi:hypothetical protein